MKKATGKFAAVAGVASVCVIAVYGSTRLLADIAIKREPPHLLRTGNGTRLIASEKQSK